MLQFLAFNLLSTDTAVTSASTEATSTSISVEVIKSLPGFPANPKYRYPGRVNFVNNHHRMKIIHNKNNSSVTSLSGSERSEHQRTKW